MKIQITLEAENTSAVTAARVESVLDELPRLAVLTGKTNAAKSTVTAGVWKITVRTDEESREVVQLTSEKALELLRRPKDADKMTLERARLQLIDAHYFCDVHCDGFASGTCPFGTEVAKCPNYNFDE